MKRTEEPLRLRRGVPVVPCGNGLLQVGLDPVRRVLVPDTPDLKGFLRELATGRGRPEDPRLVPVLARLEERGLVVDEAEEEWRRAARARTRVHLVGPPDWCARLAEHVAASGLQLGTAPADVTVLLSVGEPVREQVDELTHGGEPLLLLAAIEPRLRLGPFVLPGVTACLRCVDAHLAAGDPRRVPAPPHSPPGLPLDLSPVLINLALVRAAGDLRAWAESRQPASWSATTWTDDDLVDERRQWLRHPHCGCSWHGALLLG